MAIEIKVIKPPQELEQFIESFWMLRNSSGETKEAIIVPDGRIDLSVSKSGNEPFHITLLGLGSTYEQVSIPPGTLIFAASFNPVAAEYIFENSMATIIDSAIQLPEGSWGLDESCLQNFEMFCNKVMDEIRKRFAATKVDERKLKLFELIFAGNGATTVQELSEKVHWGSRQINRYFNRQYGLSLKAYCSIIRFRSSFQQLKQGKLFPEEHFADQSHFVKEVKKLSGVSPKKLAKNQNDRFIQFLGTVSK